MLSPEGGHFGSFGGADGLGGAAGEQSITRLQFLGLLLVNLGISYTIVILIHTIYGNCYFLSDRNLIARPSLYLQGASWKEGLDGLAGKGEAEKEQAWMEAIEKTKVAGAQKEWEA